MPMPDVLVVESPAKAKTINKYLGDGFTVLASFGHVRDLQLFGATAAHQCQLDRSGRIFEQWGILLSGCTQGHAPRLTEFQRAVRVAVDEHALYGDLVGLILLHQGRHGGIDMA